MIRHQVHRLFVLLFLLTIAPIASARRLENWSHAKLFAAADAVVVADATASASAQQQSTDNPWKLPFQGTLTTFKTRLVLKGELGKNFDVLHFAPKGPLENGPLSVRFLDHSLNFHVQGNICMNVNTGSPSYLLYLKRTKGNHLEPVSGRTDPVLSVRVMYQDVDWLQELHRGHSSSMSEETAAAFEQDRGDRQAILLRQLSEGNDDQRLRAIYLLGSHRYAAAASAIAKQLTWQIEQPKAARFGIAGSGLPAVDALIQIGKPAVQPMLKILGEDAAPHRRALAARVLYYIEGQEVAKFLVDREIEKSTGPQRTRLLESKAWIRGGEYQPPAGP